MTSSGRVLGRHVALGGALLAFACQNDSAVFDNSGLGSAASSNGASSNGGSEALGGSGSGASSMGGSTSAGKAGMGSKAGAGNDGGSQSQGGSAGKGSSGDAGSGTDAGSSQGGSTAGKGGMGGMAGMGGKPVVVPEPVMLTITSFEDTYVSSCEGFTDFGDAESVNADGDELCRVQGLIRPVLDEIPDGALVSMATLTLKCVNEGHPVSVLYVTEAWKENTARWNNRPEAGEAIGTFHCASVGDVVTIDLKVPLQAWLAGTNPYGIYLRMDTSDGTDVASSEASPEGNRPVLKLTYTLPIK